MGKNGYIIEKTHEDGTKTTIDNKYCLDAWHETLHSNLLSGNYFITKKNRRYYLNHFIESRVLYMYDKLNRKYSFKTLKEAKLHLALYIFEGGDL